MCDIVLASADHFLAHAVTIHGSSFTTTTATGPRDNGLVCAEDPDLRFPAYNGQKIDEFHMSVPSPIGTCPDDYIDPCLLMHGTGSNTPTTESVSSRSTTLLTATMNGLRTPLFLDHFKVGDPVYKNPQHNVFFNNGYDVMPIMELDYNYTNNHEFIEFINFDHALAFQNMEVC